jgi:hypothetical protein
MKERKISIPSSKLQLSPKRKRQDDKFQSEKQNVPGVSCFETDLLMWNNAVGEIIRFKNPKKTISPM